MKAAITYNPSQNGIEITFPQKPTDQIRKKLKASGFRWHGKNQHWWAVISEEVLNVANEISDKPICTTCDASINIIKRFLSLFEKRVQKKVVKAVQTDVVKLLSQGTTNLTKELEEVKRITTAMVNYTGYGSKGIQPSLDNPTLEKRLKSIIEPTQIDTESGQFQLFGVPSKKQNRKTKETNDEVEELLEKLFGDEEPTLYGLEYIPNDDHLDSEGLSGSGLTPYDVINNMILERIEKGELTWRKSWSAGKSSAGLVATNYNSKMPYKGVNWFILNLLSPGETNYWLTFNQIDGKGRKLKKGAKARPVFYYNRMYKRKDTKEIITEDEAKVLPRDKYIVIPFLKYYKVFNIADIEGKALPIPKVRNKRKVEPIESARQIIENMPKRPTIKHGGDDAFYTASGDFVQMPLLADFNPEQHYYSVLFHECVHSTGHKSRVGRDMSGNFGDAKYALEELIAEMGASYLCGEAGILYHTLDNSAAYLKGWSQKLMDIMTKDNTFFLKACAEAQKAADFILTVPKQPKSKDRKPVRKEKPMAKKVKGYGFQTVQNIVSQGAPTDKQLIILRDIKGMFDRMDSYDIDFLVLHGYGEITQFQYNSGFYPRNLHFQTNLNYVLNKFSKESQLSGFSQKGLEGIPEENPLVLVPEDYSEENENPTQPYTEEVEQPSYSPPGVRNINQVGRGHSGEVFKGDDPIFDFIGNIEKKPKGSVAITLDAPQGAGKTRFIFQFVNAMAAAGNKVLFASLEEHPDSKLFTDKRNQYLDPANYHLIDIVDEDTVRTLDDFLELAKHYDFIVGDSAGKIRNFDIDEVRRAHDEKLYAIIYQRTTEGTMRGGSNAQYDGDAVAKIMKDPDFTKNYVYWDKNRYLDKPLNEVKYSIYHQKLIENADNE